MKNDLCEKCGIGIEESPGGCGCRDKLYEKCKPRGDQSKTALHWISVKDRTPKLGEGVGYTYDGKYIRRDIYYSGYNGSWESENSLGYYITENVTHWAELPEPPK